MIFDRIGRVPALLGLTCFVALGHPQPVLAYGPQDYVLASECAPEQAAYRAAVPDGSVKDSLEWPWVYKYDDHGVLNSPDDFRAAAASLDGLAATERSGRDQAEHRLKACTARAAAARMQANFQKVTAGRVRSLVASGDCPSEQSAYLAAYTADYANKVRAEREGRDLPSEARANVTRQIGGVEYNYYMTLPGKRLERQNFLNIADAAVRTADVHRQFNKKPEVAQALLLACFYRTAAGRVGADTGQLPARSPGAPSEEALAACGADRLRDMNREIADVDSRVNAFLENSTYGKAAGLRNASPAIVVTMWALKGQVDAIRKYCPDVEAHRRRIADLESSYKTAKAACDQIQAGGAECKPAAPESLY